MFLLTRPWTSQDRSSVIGRKWTCAVKWISAVSVLELCRIFPLRGAHWNSMGTLVIRPRARWRRSVTTPRFFPFIYLFFIWLETSLFSWNVFSLSTICSVHSSLATTAQGRRLANSHNGRRGFLSAAAADLPRELQLLRGCGLLSGLVVSVRETWPIASVLGDNKREAFGTQLLSATLIRAFVSPPTSPRKLSAQHKLTHTVINWPTYSSTFAEPH